MNRTWRSLWHEEDGVLSFEWTLLVTLLVLGVVGGLAAARDSVIDELGDAAEAMLALDHSYTIDMPLSLVVDVNVGDAVPAATMGQAADSGFLDGQVFTDCGRAGTPQGQ